ncbi:hypothetical protein F5877DRAFT_67038 [Lentinula edodes]|nr:hypothetical protein F5877DRAFT_67038 [Lentinula edodes]
MAIGYVSAIHDIEVIQLTNLAAGTVIIYDHLLTLNDEFEHIWAWIISTKFVVNGKGSVHNQSLLLTHRHGCNQQLRSTIFRGFRYFHWEGGGGLITCVITESFVLSIASQGAVVGVAFKDVRAYKDTETLLCVPLLPTFSYSFWIPRLAFETVLCILALIRGFQLQKDEIGDTHWSGNDLMKMLIRDSIGYYIVADPLNYTLNTQDVRHLFDVLGGLDNKPIEE